MRKLLGLIAERERRARVVFVGETHDAEFIAEVDRRIGSASLISSVALGVVVTHVVLLTLPAILVPCG
jgi:hypothetical protein